MIHAFDTHRSGNLLILGLGRVGNEIAQDALPFFTTVSGTVRNIKQRSLDQVNIIPFQDKQHIQTILPHCTHILITVPPPKTTDAELEAVLESIDQYFPPKSWMGVISTTGVYGNHNGAWVTEQSACTSESARRFLQWENYFQQTCRRNQHSLTIFRCAGIYGPGRSALHTVFKGSARGEEQTPVVTNRIHSHDLSRAVVSCMRKSRIRCGGGMSDVEIFNLADDLPESRSVVLEYARNMFTSTGTLMPLSDKKESSLSQSTSNRARRREIDEKRVSNQRMKDILLDGGSLLYPTYKEGLKQIFQEETEPWWTVE